MDGALANCLIVGGSGNLGTNLCALLRETVGVNQVVNFDLRPSRTKQGIKSVIGDVRDKESMRVVVKEADTIWFLATAFRLTRTAADYRDSDAVCVVGLNNIIELCKSMPRSYPRRLILSSTYDTYFTGNHVRDGNEDSPRVSLDNANPYAHCKLLAERLLEECYNRRTLLTRTAILAHLFSADDKMAEALVNGACCGNIFTYEAAAESSISFVGNVSHGLIQMAKMLTVDSKKPPSCIILTDYKEPMTDLYAETFRYAGARVVSVPYGCVWLGALCMEQMYSCCVQVLRWQPWDVLYTREGISIPMTWFTFDATRAEKELGYGPNASWWTSRKAAVIKVGTELRERHNF